MESFISISCQHDDPEQVMSDCLLQLDAISASYNFAFIYATDAMSAHYPELVQRCQIKTGIKFWLGTLGVGIVAPATEFYDLPAVSIMLAHFDENEFAMLPLIQDIDALSLVKWPKKFFTHFGIIHGDPFYQGTQQLITEIPQHISDCFLVGGLTSSRDNQFQIAEKIASQGVSGVFVSENIPVLTNLTQGCSPIGKKHPMSQTHRNTILRLNEKPALDVLMQTFNMTGFEQLKQQAADIYIGLCVPQSDQNDYIVRNLVGLDIDNKIIEINDIAKEGGEMVFCQRNEQTAIIDMQKMLDKLAARLRHKPKGGIYISCLGRGRAQFGNNSEEVKMIHNTLGDFPLTGFFSNGEIHHDKLYGYTGVLTLFI